MNIGIVGHEQAKFTPDTEHSARELVGDILLNDKAPTVLVSGHCHLGGVDIYAEEAADFLRVPKLIYPPAALCWPFYKRRNIQIARASDVVHVIVVSELPPNYTGMEFDHCYHCQKYFGPHESHVKSGGCWTGIKAIRLGKKAIWHVI